MAGEGLTTKPPRVMLTDLETAEAFEFQYNPEELKEKLGANFNEPEVLGLGYKPQQYKNSDNVALSFDLVLDALGKGFSVTKLLDARRFLHSLFAPRRGSGDITSAATPRVLFSWPNYVSLVCRLRSADASGLRFNAQMQPTHYKATVNIAEARTTRLFAEDVRRFGTLRGA